jgi:hypothetical protein
MSARTDRGRANQSRIGILDIPFLFTITDTLDRLLDVPSTRASDNLEKAQFKSHVFWKTGSATLPIPAGGQGSRPCKGEDPHDGEQAPMARLHRRGRESRSHGVRESYAALHQGSRRAENLNADPFGETRRSSTKSVPTHSLFPGITHVSL